MQILSQIISLTRLQTQQISQCNKKNDDVARLFEIKQKLWSGLLRLSKDKGYDLIK